MPLLSDGQRHFGDFVKQPLRGIFRNWHGAFVYVIKLNCMGVIKNEMLGRVGHMLVAALLLCGGLASQVFADNAPASSAAQAESVLFRAVMG